MLTFTDLTLAYRQAKSALYYERRGVGMLRLAEYDADLHDNLARLRQLKLEKSWFDSIKIGDIVVVPKSTSTPKPPSPHGDLHREVVTVGAPRHGPVDLTVRVQLCPHPDFAIVEVLYLWEFGPALDALLGPSSLGYRLKLIDREIDRTSRHMFEFWPRAFARYRDEPIATARRHLRAGHACTVTSLDFTSFYDSIDPSFMTSSEFVDALKTAAAERHLRFNRARYIRATRSLLSAFTRYRTDREATIGVNDPAGIPIGALTSRLIANAALYRLDQAIASDSQTIMYQRYVDDIVVVRDAATPPSPDIAAFLQSWFPNLTATDGQFVADIQVGNNTLAFQRTKTRVHHLVGQPGIDFLDVVRESFALVASERRAFAADVEPIAEELEVLSSQRATERSRLVALRDADREVLERHRTSSLFRSMQMIVKLLSPSEAASFFRKHEGRLVAALDHRAVWENLDSILSLVRIAQLTRGAVAPEQLLSTLKFAWSATTVVEPTLKEVTWNGRKLSMSKAVPGLREYLQQRIWEALASATPLNGAQIRALQMHTVAAPLTVEAIEARGRLLRRADLRMLDREDDCTLFPEGLDEVQDCSALEDRLLKEEELRPRLGEVASFIGDCRALDDRLWEMGPLALFLSTRPPSYFDISRRILYLNERRGYAADAFVQVLAAVNAVAGSRYRDTVGRTIDSETISIHDGPTPTAARLILGNLVLEEDWWTAAVRDTPTLSHERFEGLRRVVEAARRAARTRRRIDRQDLPPALLVLPELAVPRAWYRDLGRYIAGDNRMGLILGVEYLHDHVHRQVVNQAFGIFPAGAHAVSVVPWTKRNPAQIERDELPNHNVTLRTSPRHVRTTVHSPYGRLSTLICSELLEPQALSGLLGRVELVVVPAWNRDTQSYDHMLKSAGLLVHAYIAVANNGHYSDCRAWAPIKEPPWWREVCRLIQRDADEVVWEDIATEHLRQFHQGRTSPSSAPPPPRPPRLEWRPLPPSWTHGPTR